MRADQSPSISHCRDRRSLHETAYVQPIREGCEIFFILNSKTDKRTDIPEVTVDISPSSSICHDI